MKFYKTKFGAFCISALLYMVFAQIIHALGSLVMMSYYLIPEYFPVWSKIMMPTAGPPPASFYLISLLYCLITGMLYVLGYRFVKRSMPGKNFWLKGLSYGLFIFIVAAVPFFLTFHLLINLPVVLITEWAVEMLVVYVGAGVIVAKLNK